VVKARAVTALCKSGAERERELGVWTPTSSTSIGQSLPAVFDAKMTKVFPQLRQSSMASATIV
jgi:hypothetical protein